MRKNPTKENQAGRSTTLSSGAINREIKRGSKWKGKKEKSEEGNITKRQIQERTGTAPPVKKI